MKTKLTNSIKKLFGIHKSSNLDDVFNKRIITEIPREYVNSYPLISDWMHGRAYELTFLVSEEDYTNLRVIFKELGYSIDEFTQDRVIGNESGSSSYLLSIKRDFTGIVLSIISNDHNLVVKIKKARLRPPMPSTSFPDIDPDSYGSLQGDLDFWFYHLWLPFWSSLTSEEKEQLPIDKAWRDFIESHI